MNQKYNYESLRNRSAGKAHGNLRGNFAAIDFETANGNRTSVCSVGIVIVKDGRIVDKFYSLIKPTPNFYTYFTTRVHGLTREDTDSAPTFPEVWAQIADKLEGLPLVAHNKPFDEGCLKAVFAAYKMPYPGYDFHCTLAASRSKLSLPSHQLHISAAACGYDMSNHHHALCDAEACAAIALKLLC
ncbi:MAG: 3'-5' exonuclease [Muribaculaceae bacterium]|nr:3'-5' exonuclease [Muribaculaceae bacterium]